MTKVYKKCFFVPYYVWRDPNLDWTCKVVWIEINNMQGWTFDEKFIAELADTLNMEVQDVAYALDTLVDNHYLAR